MTKIKVDTNVFGQLTSLNIINQPIIANTSASSEIDIDDTDANISASIKKSQNEASDLITNILLEKLNKATYDGFISLTLQSSYSIVQYSTKLTIPPVYDFSETVDANMFFRNTVHSFYKGYPVDTGTPTFGTNESSFGIGAIKFKKNQAINLKIHNQTEYNMNMHWHGMNLNAYNDGASGENMFGPDTLIGPIFDLIQLRLTNNGCVMWVHPHPMFQTMYFVYLGLVGLVLMEDEASKHVDDYFVYGDNHVPIIVADINYDDTGAINLEGLDGFQLGDYSIINGTSCLSWDLEETNNKYINKLYHQTSSNLVKLTFLNGAFSFRIYGIGVCDKYDNVKYFTQICTDQGYRDPLLLDHLFIAPGERVSILFDLNDFQDNEAYLFFYLLNAQNGGSSTYPVIPAETRDFIAKNKYLKVTYSEDHDPSKDYNLISVLTDIQKLVFGDNYETFINLPPFQKLDYGKYLNKKYFYNLPDFNEVNIQSRSILFMLDLDGGTKDNGGTEYCAVDEAGQDRVWSDMWTDAELKLYEETGDNLYLPTCLFFISKYSGDYLEYENYKEQDNHELIINIYKDESLSEVYKTVTISFPESETPMNIRIWMELVSSYFSSTYFLDDDDNEVYISDILDYYWEVYKFEYTFNITSIINTVKMFIQNKSDYYVELKGKWTLLTFFGKPFRGIHDEDTESSHEMNGNDIPVTMIPVAGSRSGEDEYPDDDDLFSLVVYPQELYAGFCDGFNNDNFRVFSVKNDFSEKWVLENNSTDFHPIHFHNTSAYAELTDNNQSYTLDQIQRLAYSKDTYPLDLGTKLEIRLKFPFNSGENGLIKYLGYMIHCHFLDHHDMNMMNQFFVYNNKSDYFY